MHFNYFNSKVASDIVDIKTYESGSYQFYSYQSFVSFLVDLYVKKRLHMQLVKLIHILKKSNGNITC